MPGVRVHVGVPWRRGLGSGSGAVGGGFHVESEGKGEGGMGTAKGTGRSMRRRLSKLPFSKLPFRFFQKKKGAQTQTLGSGYPQWVGGLPRDSLPEGVGEQPCETGAIWQIGVLTRKRCMFVAQNGFVDRL